MTFIGTVKDGKIALPPDVTLPDGTAVRIEPVDEDEPQSIRAVLKEFEGIATDLPPDFAAQHDHYIHGHPKK